MNPPDPFFVSTPDYLCTVTLDGRLQQVNPAFRNALNLSEEQLLGMNLLDLVHAGDRDQVAPRIADLARGNALPELVTRFRSADGSYLWLAWSGTPVIGEGRADIVAHDPSARATEPRTPQAACLCALDYSTDGFFALDADWRLVRINQEAERLWNRTRSELLGRDLREVFPETRDSPFHTLLENAMGKDSPAHAEQFYPHPPRQRWLEIHAYPSGGGLAVYFRDVTERHEAQERIRRAVQEKEVLLREVHHRVKNNLQVICSMLRLQERNLEDQTLVPALRDCRERVLAMAMLHDQLHRAKDFSNINLGEYIRNLAASLFSAYGVNSSDIAFDLRVEDITVSVDTAIPCGLLMNEIVSNSLRHAFPSGKGRVALGLHNLSGGRIELTVSDDGKGFPEPESATTRSLGLRLVDLLAEQFDARMERSARHGTSYRLIFKLTRDKENKNE